MSHSKIIILKKNVALFFRQQCFCNKHSLLSFIQEAISELPCASVLKPVFVQNLSYENHLHENEQLVAWAEHIFMNRFSRRIVLTHRQKAIQKGPITCRHRRLSTRVFLLFIN